jgi:rod shape-determining protein MreD
MTIYLVVPLLVVITVLQATVFARLAVWGVFVDLPLLIVVSWSLLQGAREGVLWGFIGGVAVDLLSGAPFGAATLSMMAVGLLSGLGKQGPFGAHVIFPVVVAFVATIVYSALFMLILLISGELVAWIDNLFRIILPSALLNAALMPAVFFVMRVLHRRFAQEEMEW